MKPQNILAKAISLVAHAFEGKLDRGGRPYILHCLQVMNAMDPKDEELMCIAVMHDLLEDTHMTPEDLKELGFSARIINAVTLLTRDDVVDYDTYIRKISFNEDARKVKLADLEDNSRITRLKGLRKVDFERLEKYHKAYVYLSKH